MALDKKGEWEGRTISVSRSVVFKKKEVFSAVVALEKKESGKGDGEIKKIKRSAMLSSIGRLAEEKNIYCDGGSSWDTQICVAVKRTV